MGKDCGSWMYRQKHSPWQSSNLNCGNAPPNIGFHPTMFPTYATRMEAASRFIPGAVVSEAPELKWLGGNEPQTWHYCFTRPAFSPTPKSILGEKFFVSPCGEAAPNQKSFIVFDKSGNRTSLILTSAGHHLKTSSTTIQVADANHFRRNTVMNDDSFVPAPPAKESFWCGLNGSQEDHERNASVAEESEMHEDTEEIDALLYSDEEDEETSTGHFPGEMTGYELKEASGDDDAVVASSLTPTKRRRIEEECDPSLLDTASSRKTWQHDDDAESSCVRGRIQGGREIASPPNKRLRKERIREAVGVLRSIIPGGKGKDASAVLDEAIRYLRTLRLKAKAL